MSDQPEAQVPPLGHLVAALTGDRTDVSSLAHILTGVLADAFPAGVVTVQHSRSMTDRLTGKPGQTTGVTITLGDNILTLRQASDADVPEAVVAHAVRGVTISRSPVPITDWITTLAQLIQQRAADDAAAHSALTRLLLG